MGVEETAAEEDCVTPKRGDCRIPENSCCPPPPPRKKPVQAIKQGPPKNGYFRPDDLDALFSVKPRKEGFL
ncbi:hypothetical protein CDL15_Pgr020608 [Punica granatum]|uniref:Cyclin-dependent protein kinase inhibitor SMR4 n=1 Tax=Punica granatum TaxID=22663 RepID=A0A218VXB6_PUNGR|nr:hypothetical protein CDL15_Pgr020608 [Punica granatum]